MKKSEDDDIKINRRSGDRAIFESNFLQQISDGIDFLKEESKEFLKELDKSDINELDIEEFGDITLNHISDIVDEISQLKSEFINEDDLPESIKISSKNIKIALNRDEDYTRRAQRKLNRVNSDDFVDSYKANIRIIELCNKAIDLNHTNHKAYYLKGRALSNMDKYPEAIEEFIKSLAIKDDIEVWIAIANTNTLNGDYEDALNVYDSVLEKDENSFDAFKGKALTYYACGDYDKAVVEFKKAAAIDSLDSISKQIWDECLENV